MIYIPIKAVGKQRPQFCFKGKYAYTPKKTKDFQSIIAGYAAIFMKDNCLTITDGPIAINVIIDMKVPKSWSKAKKEAALNGEVRVIKKPDNDNMEKAIWDSMEQIVYFNDSQIVDNCCRKFYGVEDIIHISIRYLPVSPYYKLKYPVVSPDGCSCDLCIF